jgi:hypothetical protein
VLRERVVCELPLVWLAFFKDNKITSMKKKPLAKQDNDDNSLPADLLYSPKDDIYNKGKREENIDPDDQSVIDPTREVEGKGNEKDFNEDKSGDDLDIPGAELDDPDEKVGEEDEENNYYSLGGDNHDNLEESKE